MKKIVKILAISLLISICITFVKNQFGYILFNNAEFGMQTLINKKSVDNLFIGSSMFRQGIDANDISEKTGKDTYLLYYNGNQPMEEQLQLEYLLKNDVEIKNLYVDLYLYTAMSRFYISDSKMFLDTDIPFKAKNLQSYNKFSFKKFYEMFVTANNEIFLTFPISFPLINQRSKNGSNTAVIKGSTEDKLSEAEIPDKGDELKQDQIKAIKNILSIAKEHNINVYFIETPKYKRILDSDVYIPLMEELVEKTYDEDAEYILLDYHTIDKDNINKYSFDETNAEFFSDLIHMSTAGKEVFSDILTAILGEL